MGGVFKDVKSTIITGFENMSMIFLTAFSSKHFYGIIMANKTQTIPLHSDTF